MANKAASASTMFMKNIGSFIAQAMLGAFKRCHKFLTNKYTKDVLWSITEICITLAMFIILALATCYMTIILNINEAMKNKNNLEVKLNPAELRNINCKEELQQSYKLKGIPEEKTIEQLAC